MAVGAMRGPMAERRADVDWLRVFATYLLFPFHISKIFDVAPYYHLKNAELSADLGAFTGFVHQWHMPLFFVLAGWSVPGSLAARGPGGFLRERVQRLFVPFAFGCLVLCPPIRWIEVQRWPQPPFQTFGQFLPHFFGDLRYFTWSHLWFLIYLFVFSCLYLPLLAALGRRPMRFAAIPSWVVYAAIVPFALVQVAFRGRWPGMQNLYDDWGNFFYYSLFFLCGFLLGRVPALEERVHRESRRLGRLGLLAFVVLAAASVDGSYPPPALTPRYVLFWSASALAGVGFVAACLGFAARRLRVSNAALRYLSESAFPVYILHQLAIVTLATWVIDLPLSIPTKWTLLILTAPTLTLATYHVVVRPFPPLRHLLGMKPTQRAARGAAPIPAQA